MQTRTAEERRVGMNRAQGVGGHKGFPRPACAWVCTGCRHTRRARVQVKRGPRQGYADTWRPQLVVLVAAPAALAGCCAGWPAGSASPLAMASHGMGHSSLPSGQSGKSPPSRSVLASMLTTSAASTSITGPAPPRRPPAGVPAAPFLPSSSLLPVAPLTDSRVEMRLPSEPSRPPPPRVPPRSAAGKRELRLGRLAASPAATPQREGVRCLGLQLGWDCRKRACRAVAACCTAQHGPSLPRWLQQS